MIRNYKERLITKSKSFAFHCSSNHSPSLSGSNYMTEQRVTAIHNSCNCIFLMFAENYFGVHTAKGNMTSVILTRSVRVKLFVIKFCKSFSSVGVLPYPIIKFCFDKVLLLLSYHCFFLIENGFLFAFFILNIIENANIFKVKRFLNDFVSIYSLCTKGICSFNTLVIALV